MKLANVLLFNAFLFIAAGIAFALYGPLMIDFFGVLELGENNSPMYWYVASFARLFGAALFGAGFMLWAARGWLDQHNLSAETRRRTLLALVLANLMALFVTLIQQLTVWVSPAGWIAAAFYLTLLGAYSYFLIRQPQTETH